MTKFVCRNKDCKKYGVEVEYTQVTYRFVNGELRAECAECPECGQEREEINENADKVLIFCLILILQFHL